MDGRSRGRLFNVMAMTLEELEELEAEIRNLPQGDREVLIKRLQTEKTDQTEVERLQKETVRNRYRDIVEGRVKTASGEAVLKRAKAMLNEDP